MKYRNPLKRILTETRSSWDHDGTRDSVRRVFASALKCRTAELGAEVYASDSQEFIHYHTCKSRACTSCGNRASIQWRRERWAALPTQSYHGITFTMPDVLWPLFRDNPTLAKALPALAAGVIQAQAATEARPARRGHGDSAHIQWQVRVQFARTHHADGGRIARLLRSLGGQYPLRP
jgi:Transposase zinc-binding domain